MPRAKMTNGRLYNAEITALQRIIRLVNEDKRIVEMDRNRVLSNVAGIVNVLNNAQSGHLTTKDG